MVQKALEALDEILDAELAIIEDRVFQEPEEKDSSLDKIINFLTFGNDFYDEKYIYNRLKQINRKTPNKIKLLIESYKKVSDLEGLTDIRTHSLPYKIITAPLWLPKKVKQWTFEKFSNESFALVSHYLTLAAEIIGVSYMSKMTSYDLSLGVSAWGFGAEIFDKLLHFDYVSELFNNLWSSQINYKQGELLRNCRKKKIPFGKLHTTILEFINDYENNMISSNNFDELLDINPQFKEFLDTINSDENEYKFMALETTGLISGFDLLTKGSQIMEESLRFYNLKTNIDPKKKKNYCPIEGNHIIGSILRKVEKDLLDVAKKSSIELEWNSDDFKQIKNYQPILELRESNTDEKFLVGQVKIPLSKIQEKVDLEKLISSIKTSISNYIIGGNLIPYPRLVDCPEIIENSVLDLSTIADLNIDINDFIQIFNTVNVDESTIFINYEIYSASQYTNSILDSTIRKECKVNPVGIFDPYNTSRGYKSKVRESEYKESDMEKLSEIKESVFPVLSIRELENQYQRIVKDYLESELEKLYEQKVNELQNLVSRDPTNTNVFNLGLYLLFKDKQQGEKYINQAIENGFLEENVQVSLLGINLGEQKNKNPLKHLNSDIKRQW